MALVVTVAQAARRPYIRPQQEAVSRLYAQCPKCSGSGSQSLGRRYLLEGDKWGGNVKLVKAMVLQVAAMRLPPRLHYSPNQLQAAMSLGTCGGQARPSRQLARMGNKVRQLQGWPHGQLRAARKLQQEFRQGAARMHAGMSRAG